MIGVDITDLSRFTEEEGFLRHLLTEEERKEYEQRKTHSRKMEYLGGRFATKEAIFKATGDPQFLSYSILNDAQGKPYIKDHPELSVSISHDGGLAVVMGV